MCYTKSKLNTLMKRIFLVIVAITLVGCASSPYVYHEKPISLKKGISNYYLKDVVVNLSLGHGAIPGSDTFVNEEKLQNQFLKSLESALEKKGILALNSQSADGDLDITIDYIRKFNYGGKALNKPLISHVVDISRDGEKLASFSLSAYTTRYSYFKDIAVNLEIGTFQWGADDEIQDVNYVANHIAEMIFKVGK